MSISIERPRLNNVEMGSLVVGFLLPHDGRFFRQADILASIEQFRIAFFEPVKPFSNLWTAEEAFSSHSHDLLIQLVALTIIAILVEWPIYVWMLRKKANRNVSLPAITANAISYPVYYTLIVIGVYCAQVLNWPT